MEDNIRYIWSVIFENGLLVNYVGDKNFIVDIDKYVKKSIDEIVMINRKDKIT